MKKFVLSVLMVLCMTSVSMASVCSIVGPAGPQGPRGYTGAAGATGAIGQDANQYNDYGVVLDAPYLIEIHRDWYVGTEAGHNFNHTNSNEGYTVVGKVTYTGTWFSFNKK